MPGRQRKDPDGTGSRGESGVSVVLTQLGSDPLRTGWRLGALFLEQQEYTVTYKEINCPTVSLKQVLSTHKAARVLSPPGTLRMGARRFPVPGKSSGRTAHCKSVDSLKRWHSAQSGTLGTVLTTLAAESNAPWGFLFDLHEHQFRPGGLPETTEASAAAASKKAEVSPWCRC